MNCNEEFVVRALGKLTLEFDFDWEQQIKIREVLHLSLRNFEVLSEEKGLMVSDLKEKIFLYLQVRKLEHYSEQTLKNYFYILNNFSDFIVKPVATITKNDIRYFLASVSGGLKASTMNNKISTLKAFFQWLEDEEIIPKNPTRQINVTKLPKRLKKALNVEELERMRLACETTRERALIEFLFATGCRVSEVTGVNISDLNLYNNTLTVVGKGDKERIVCFSDKTRLYLQQYIDQREDSNVALFIGTRKPFARIGARSIEVIISNIGKRTSINRSVFPHLLRSSMATLGLQAGANITTIQHLLGHSSPTVTQLYAEKNIDNIKHEYGQCFIH